MKKQNPAVMYGLIGAAILIIIGMGMQMLIMSMLKKTIDSGASFSPMKLLGISIISFLLIIAVFVFCLIKAIKDFRKTSPDYTYKKLVGQGLLATLIIAFVSTAFSLLYSEVIDPGSRQKNIDLTVQVYENMSMPEAQKEKAIEQIQNQDPVRQTVTSLSLTLFFGLIVSLISASVMNKKGKEFPNSPNNLS
jgi:ABC-type phosphate/phosphonate transport system permease subunit